MTDQMTAAEYRTQAGKGQASAAKTNFESFLQRGEFGDVVKEYRFHPTRRFRFDWAFPERKIAFEYDGLTSATNRHRKAGDDANKAHASISGVLRDSEKINEAQLLGWQVYRVNAKSIGDGSAYTVARRALERDPAWPRT